jgi:hypothetical protein
MMREVEERTFPRITKVVNFWEMRQSKPHQSATKKESPVHNMRMTFRVYILDLEEIFRAFWEHFPHQGAAGYKLSDTTPLPPAFSSKVIPGGQMQVLNMQQIT